jgi:hypothetical protein
MRPMAAPLLVTAAAVLRGANAGQHAAGAGNVAVRIDSLFK